MMITGRTDDAAVVMSLDIGAVDHITKPFRPAEIEARIRCFASLA